MDISITEKFFVATPSFISNCNTTHPSKWKGTPAEDYNPKIVRYNDLLHFLDGFPPHPSYTNMSHCIPSQHPLPGAITLTKKELPCTICNRFFLRPSTLRVHMRIHNGEKPFKCTYCPKAFSQSGNLTVHLRTHTGEKPFPCHVCGKSFSQSTSLTGHLRTHTGERPYQCDGCNKSFADRSTLTKHRRTHTRAEWVKTRDFPMRDTIEHLQFQRCIEMTAQY